MKDFEKILKDDYPEKLNTLKFSDKQKLYALYESPKHSSTIRRGALITNAISAALVIALTAGVGVAGTAIYHSLQDRTAVVETEDTTQERNCDPLPENRFDMIGITDPNIEGNCYMQDFYELQKQHFISYDKNGDGTIVTEPLDYTLTRNWAYLFDDDGYTIIGKTVRNMYPDDEVILNEATYSLEELEDPEIQKLLTGTEEENAEYEERIRTRLEARKQEEENQSDSSEEYPNIKETNKYGEIYGNWDIGEDYVDLISIGNGYCYFDDFWDIQGTELLGYDENGSLSTRPRSSPLTRNWIYIFNEDGDEIVGKWVQLGTTPKFYSNEELENPEIQKSILGNEEDVAEYEERVRTRLEAKGVTLSDSE